MHIADLLRPIPPIDTEELDRVAVTSRLRYALRVTGWMLRCGGTVGALTAFGRALREPAFRAHAATWPFVMYALGILIAAAIPGFLVSAWLLWPALRRMAAGRLAPRVKFE